MMLRLLSLFLLLVGFASEARAAEIFDRPFPGTDGAESSLRERMGDARFLVVTFFSADCPCQALHDGRLRELHERYGPRGVAVVSVNSEVRSSRDADAKEAERRAYPFPMLTDPEGVLAKAFGARFATYTVVLDREGKVRYRGGLDSDRTRLTDEAKHWVRMALDRLLAGEDPQPAQTKAFGCFLRRR